ncbi:TIGR02679 domain-containing protein [Arthrobacter sp. V4I6]|uniref:TIGR02679 domain-containing protein n=1 Tax=unclassified Arthrobacter TaxID=235627 RepID=UPI0035932E5A
MAWLVDRVRGRILGSCGEPLRGVVQLNETTPGQRSAAVRLVGRPKRAGMALRVDLTVVEEILRRGPWPAGLADAVETLTGPVIDRRARREREAAAWDVARDGLARAVARFPGLPDWWEAWCSAGVLGPILSPSWMSVRRLPFSRTGPGCLA